MMTLAILAVLGVWMAVAPLVTGSSLDNLFNNWVVGLIVTNLALMFMSNDVRWERYLLTAAGIWLFASGFMPGLLTGRAETINSVTLGVLLIVAAVAAGLHYRHYGHESPDPIG
jgi:hypothetical protein